ncbi:MAG: hypothetical protein SFW36_18750 [Leptolyngbyaceae cyanobacterium bins.59]|nr:hypothetical protein [Leptolyngbyaceae cyanobacterium bins.59]
MHFEFEEITGQPNNSFERDLLQSERSRHRSVLSQLKHELREARLRPRPPVEPPEPGTPQRRRENGNAEGSNGSRGRRRGQNGNS